MTKHWRVNGTAYTFPRGHKPVALLYDPTPGGKRNEETGTTTYSLVFPALLLTDIVSDQQQVAEKIALELNSHDMLVKALRDALCELTACANQLAAKGLPGHEGDSVSRAQAAAREVLSLFAPQESSNG